ncbi:MAG: 50S ribosomal protein L19 [Puniceicoccales bacterium]|jgi:large subunit ribosomal protein L19|nr:50S ribosomal protein L19 [Puniceicoccales bacterium]
MNRKIRKITESAVRQERIGGFKVGDGVRVHVRIREGEKERVQIFSGIVLARKGTGATETFTVRRISYGVGVEKVFPIHSPFVEKIEVDRRSVIMRAKLYYLRDRIGKEATKVREPKRNTAS